MQDDRFKIAEDKLLELKKQLAAGSLTPSQFRQAVEGLTVKDARGRSWRLADNGKWYLDEAINETPPSAAAEAESAPRSLPTAPDSSGGLRRVAALVLAVLFLVNAAGAAYVLRGNSLNLNLGAGSKPTAPPTNANSANAPAAAPSLRPGDPAIVPSSGTPAGTELPAGLYVTNLRTNPTSPRRNQEVTFSATFLNVVGKPQSTRWTVLIFRQNELAHALGQTGTSPLPALPAGTAEVPARGTWKITGPGSCENFIARVALVEANSSVTLLKKPDGQIFGQTFTVCP